MVKYSNYSSPCQDNYVISAQSGMFQLKRMVSSSPKQRNTKQKSMAFSINYSLTMPALIAILTFLGLASILIFLTLVFLDYEKLNLLSHFFAYLLPLTSSHI